MFIFVPCVVAFVLLIDFLCIFLVSINKVKFRFLTLIKVFHCILHWKKWSAEIWNFRRFVTISATARPRCCSILEPMSWNWHMPCGILLPCTQRSFGDHISAKFFFLFKSYLGCQCLVCESYNIKVTLKTTPMYRQYLSSIKSHAKLFSIIGISGLVYQIKAVIMASLKYIDFLQR